MNKMVKYYVTGHTAAGYVNYVMENLQEIKKVLVLQHDQPSAMKPIFRQIADTFDKQGETVELISGLTHEDALVGVILRNRGTAVLDTSIVQESIPSAIDVDVSHFTGYADNGYDKQKEKEVLATAYSHFKQGLTYHDHLEDIYIQEMDFEKANIITEELIQQILKKGKQQHREPIEYRRLFGTNTPDGKVNHVTSLIAPIKDVYYVKGRAGTGKSVLMKKVLYKCQAYGYDTEVYHCSFDPESVDMVLVRDLDFCIFDSTPPHEFFPKHHHDQVIDLYEKTVTKGTDEKHQATIRYWTDQYQAEMKKGMQTLKRLKPIYGDIINQAPSQAVINDIQSYITKRI